MGKVPYLISGDDRVSVNFFANQLGMKEFFANYTPEEKLKQVEIFQLQGKKVLAIGDGVNDAPLLGLADISIAMGQAAPLSQVGADFILFNSNFITLQKALIHAKNTQVIIRQNLIWALLYNLIALPLAILGFIGPLGAAAGMSLSSILVCFNASRLGKWKLR
jgi:Cu2+-exporting ATPase